MPTLTVTVVDASTSRPIADAFVLVSPAGARAHSAMSGAGGDVAFDAVPLGRSAVFVTAPAYVDHNDQVEFTAPAGAIALVVKLEARVPRTPASPFTTQSPARSATTNEVPIDEPTGPPGGDDPPPVITTPNPPPAIFPIDVVDYVDGVPHVRKENIGDLPVGVGGIAPYITIGVVALEVLGHIFGGHQDVAPVEAEVESVRRTVVSMAAALAAWALGTTKMDAKGASIAGGVIGLIATIINWLADHALQLAEKLKDWLAPLTKVLKKITDRIKQIYEKWLRPIIKAIDIVRTFLRILEFFHIKWAQKADAALATLEQKLTAPILKVLAYVNEISGWINRIVTLDGLLQRVLLLKSLVDQAAGVANAFWNSQTKKVDPVDNARRAAEKVSHVNPHQYVDDLDAFLEGDGGTVAAVVEELVPVWRIAAGTKAPIEEPF